MLISEEYRNLNRDLHSDIPEYGKSIRTIESGFEMANKLIGVTKSETVLDYGCGKGRLVESLQARWPSVAVSGYDPAVESFSEQPAVSDVVVSFDVMEHIEPECLTNVLAHIKELTRVVALIEIATTPAMKTLRDGRNAHLIVESHAYWKDLLERHWRIVLEEEHKMKSIFVLQSHYGVPETKRITGTHKASS